MIPILKPPRKLTSPAKNQARISFGVHRSGFLTLPNAKGVARAGTLAGAPAAIKTDAPTRENRGLRARAGTACASEPPRMAALCAATSPTETR